MEKANSFEQLCINYTNESLQQQFNQYVFKVEQMVYASEGVTWVGMEFYDNVDCLNAIEGRNPPGILSLLEQVCVCVDLSVAALYMTHLLWARVF